MFIDFLKRFGAFIIDVTILGIIMSFFIIALPKSKEYDDAVKRGEKLASEVIDDIIDNQKINEEKLTEEGIEIRYIMDKESIHISLIRIVLYIAYFGTFAYYQNGQTIGKKILKIRLKSNSSMDASIIYILRAILVHGLIFNLINAICVVFLDSHSYFNLYTITNTLNFLFLVSTVIVYFSRKDKRMLHDLIFKTEIENVI